MAEFNPYLSHLPEQSNLRKKVNMANGSAGGSRNGAGVSDALDGFVPRKVNGVQCTKAMVRRTQVVLHIHS